MIETWQEFRGGTTTWLAVGQLPLVFRLLSHHTCVYLSCDCFLNANVTYSGLLEPLSLTSVTTTSFTYTSGSTPQHLLQGCITWPVCQAEWSRMVSVERAGILAAPLLGQA